MDKGRMVLYNTNEEFDAPCSSTTKCICKKGMQRGGFIGVPNAVCPTRKTSRYRLPHIKTSQCGSPQIKTSMPYAAYKKPCRTILRNKILYVKYEINSEKICIFCNKTNCKLRNILYYTYFTASMVTRSSKLITRIFFRLHDSAQRSRRILGYPQNGRNLPKWSGMGWTFRNIPSVKYTGNDRISTSISSRLNCLNRLDYTLFFIRNLSTHIALKVSSILPIF